MKRSLFLIFVLIEIIFIIKSVNAVSKLHVEGTYIKNETNHTIFLRGINKHGFEDHSFGYWQTPEGGFL